MTRDLEPGRDNANPEQTVGVFILHLIGTGVFIREVAVLMKRWLAVLLVLCGSALAGPGDAVDCLQRYYDSLDKGRFFEADGLRSAHFSQSVPGGAFISRWRNNVGIEVSGIRLKMVSADRARASYQLVAVDADVKTGQRTRAQYTAVADLVNEGGWHLDSVQVELVKSTPVTGVEMDRYVRLLPGESAPPLPADIPVYPGYRLSKPMRVVDKDRPEVKWNLVVSLNRQPSLAPSQVAKFYREKLAGWDAKGPAGGGTSLQIELAKGQRKLQIQAYSGICGDTDELPDPRGTRLEIKY